jgi:hypothetical protein
MKLAQTMLILLASAAVGGAFAQDGSGHGPPSKPSQVAKSPQTVKPAPAKVPTTIKPARTSHR